MGVHVRGERSIQITATPDVVYAVVSDLTSDGRVQSRVPRSGVTGRFR